MANNVLISHGEIMEGESPLFVARVEDRLTGLPLVSTDVSSVNVEVYKTPSATPDVSEYELGAISPASVYFDTLQYGADNLLGDAGGYNFRLSIGNDEFTFRGGNTYLVQIKSLIGSSTHTQKHFLKVVEVY